MLAFRSKDKSTWLSTPKRINRITIIDKSINKLNGLLTNRGGAAYLMGYAVPPLFAFSRPCTSVAFCNRRARTRK